MSLADYWDNEGPGNYLKEGWHTVTVEDCDVFEYNSGSPGVKFTVKDTAGAQSKASFVLLPQCMWNLTNFAKACGLTREQGAKYDPDRESCHRMLLRKSLQVHVVLEDDKYSTVDDWAAINENVSDTPTPKDPRLAKPQAPATAPTGRGIPF